MASKPNTKAPSVPRGAPAAIGGTPGGIVGFNSRKSPRIKSLPIPGVSFDAPSGGAPQPHSNGRP